MTTAVAKVDIQSNTVNRIIKRILRYLVLTVIRNACKDNKNLRSIRINKLITATHYSCYLDAKFNIISYLFTENLYLHCYSHFNVLAFYLTHPFDLNTALIGMSRNSKKLTKQGIFCTFLSLVKDPFESQKSFTFETSLTLLSEPYDIPFHFHAYDVQNVSTQELIHNPKTLQH